MRRLRWQILVVLATLVVVAVLLLSQQPVLTPILPEAAPGGVYSEALVGSLGRLNPLLDWNNPADRDAKHNLELALEKLKESRQQKQNSGNEKQNLDQKPSGQPPPNDKEQKKEGQRQPPPQEGSSAEQKENQNQQRSPKDSSSQNEMERAQAQRMLDAFENQEKQEQRKQALRALKRSAGGKDW